ncbi:hypothetical protein [Candidatus Thiothrix anitrata]|uniref:DUF4129 domain-containing protein n=1 Tax=Candidatus Thiothrix anitrata TaxID=2823902 RepID=A0ABX7X3F9_9GAMM|nr:hypothetical protein [Candidatus Thiothrix anitrata]QTR49817.1 hypothetical protein J8380_16590 [Candidatus Thiothrix anitrata]
MQLNDITTQIRLRSAWEAADLGLTMVQHNWRLIYLIWTFLLLSFGLLAWVLLPVDYLIYAPMLVWWFKPVFDRVLLFILSQQLFAQTLSAAQVMSALPGLLRHTGVFSALTWRRFSLSRGFNLPIWQLEQLRGEPRKQRQQLLHQQTHGHAVWLTVACVHLEYVVIFSLYALVVWLDPNDYAWDYLTGIFANAFDDEVLYWGALIYFVVWLTSVWLIEPLYVAASFSLYLNRRTHLEAWDIELAFRKLAERLRQLAPSVLGLLLVMVCGFATLTPAPLWADSATDKESVAATRLHGDEARAQIEVIMQRNEFSQVRKVERWTARETDEEEIDTSEWLKSLQAITASVMKIALWIAVVILVLVGIAYRRQLLALLKPLQTKTHAPPPPDILFGMDIRPESLPDDIAAASQRLWENGQHREALSLLYRAALMRLTRHDKIAILDSHTEGDILGLARSVLSKPRLIWLTALTGAWQQVAYAHRTPADAKVLPLMRDWQAFSTEPLAEATP